MQKRTYSGLKAGIVQRSISNALYFLTEFNILQSWFSNKAIVLDVPATFLLGIFVLMYAVSAVIFGAIVGMIYVRVEGNIPIASTYVKAPFFYTIIWLLVTAYFWFLSGNINGLEFIWNTVSALVFAYLFNRWTSEKKQQ